MRKNLLPFRLLSLLVIICLASYSSWGQLWDTLAPIPSEFTFPVTAVVNGKLHIMGGGGPNGATDLHYAYDPATDSWESKAAVPYAAQQPAGAAANGKIHFFGGGYPNTGTPLDDHYIYDPVTDTWEEGAMLTAPRAIHYSVGLNGLIYSLAGQGMTTLCQTYDAGTDSWSDQNDLPDGSFWYGAHVAVGGHIYRFCGGAYIAPNNLAHRYDPLTDEWTALPGFPAAIHGLRGAAIGDKIYCAGGYYDFLERDEVYIFDTQTETYSAGPSLPLGRNYHNMASLDSCIYVIGGNHALDETVKTQLIRYCPFGDPVSTEEVENDFTLVAHYQNGFISLQNLPAHWKNVGLTLFDISGREIYRSKLGALSPETLEIWVGLLDASMYILQLKPEHGIYTTKLIVSE